MKRAAVALLLLAAPTGALAERLMLATWNLEWMMTPATFDRLAAVCLDHGLRAGGSDRAIPCDIVPKARWSDEEIARISRFASTLPADVIALQEIDGVEIASRIFPDREFCFTKRLHVQNVGVAIKRGVPYRCNRDYRALGLAENGVRWGVDVTIYPGTPREVRILGLHLKASCNRDPLWYPREDCAVLSEQVPILEAWIDRRAKNGDDFAVIGDFNRRFEGESEPARDPHGRVAAMWPELDDGEPAGADLTDAGADHGPLACNNGFGGRQAIDHLVLGRRLARRMVADSFRVWEYPFGPRWPDHCVISVELDLEPGDGV